MKGLVLGVYTPLVCGGYSTMVYDTVCRDLPRQRKYNKIFLFSGK